MKKEASSRDVALGRLCRRESIRRRTTRLLCLWQSSPLYRLMRAYREVVAATPLHAFSLFLAPLGLAALFRCLLLPLLTDDFVLLPWDAFAGIVLSLVSFLLSFYHAPLSRAAASDSILSRLLFDTLALPRPYVTERRGLPWWLLLPAGLGFGVLSVFVSPLLLLGILTASALFLPALEVPEVSLVLVGILFPFTGLLSSPLLLLTVLVLFALFSYLLKLAVGKRHISISLGDLFVLLFSLTILFTGLFTPSGADGSISGFTAAVLAMGGYFLAANLLRTRRTILLLSRGLLSAGTVLGILGILLGAVRLSSPTLDSAGFLFHLTEGIRAITGESFSAYLLLLFPLAFGLAGISRRHLFESLPTLLLLLAALALTLSPATYLAAILSLVVFFVAARVPFRGIALVSFLLFAVLPIGFALVPASFIDTVAPHLAFLGLDGALPAAFMQFREGLLLIKAHPLGIGAGLFELPSLYLGMVLESGVAALVLFLAALYSSLRRGLVQSNDRASRPLRYLSAGVASGLLALPVNGMLENGFADRRVLFLFFLLLGLLTAIGRTAGEEKSLYLDQPAEPRLASLEVRVSRETGHR